MPDFGARWRESGGGGPTLVAAPTRAGREEIVRELKAAAVAAGQHPVTVRFGPRGEEAVEPQAALLAQLRPLMPGRDDDDLLHDLRSGALARRTALFVEEIDRRAPGEEALLRLLLRVPGDVSVSAAGDPAADAVVRATLGAPGSLRRVEPRPLGATEVADRFPEWLGAPLPDELAKYLGLERGADPARLVETLTYLVECGALDVDAGRCRLDLAKADLALATSDLLDVMRRRVALLPAESRRVLALLAVLDAEVEPRLLGFLGVANDAALGRIDGALALLIDQGLVERRGEGIELCDGSVRAAALETLGERSCASCTAASRARSGRSATCATPGRAARATRSAPTPTRRPDSPTPWRRRSCSRRRASPRRPRRPRRSASRASPGAPTRSPR
jgi:hypothetical protein